MCIRGFLNRDSYPVLPGKIWTYSVALGGAVGWRTGGLRAGAYSTVALVLVGVISDWHLAMLTLAIMTVSVVIALVIGVPLGVLTARSLIA